MRSRATTAGVSWHEAWLRSRLHVMVGLGWLALLPAMPMAPRVWALPLLLGLLATWPLTVWSSRVSLGALARRFRLLLTPEEAAPAPILRGLPAGRRRHPAGGAGAAGRAAAAAAAAGRGDHVIRAALLALVLAGTVAPVWTASPAWAQEALPPGVSTADQAAIRSVIGRQLDAFRRDDAPGAYAFAAPSIQRLFPDAEVFIGMVRRGYAPVYRPRSVEFTGLGLRDGELVQEVELIGPDGEAALALYTMVRMATVGRLPAAHWRAARGWVPEPFTICSWFCARSVAEVSGGRYGPGLFRRRR